jgi:hypothetical protein
MNGGAVAGLGFHERTLPLSSPRQLAIVLRDSLLHLPDDAVADGPLTAAQLAALAEETLRLVVDGRFLAAQTYIEDTVRPALVPIAESYRSHLMQIADDLLGQMAVFA